MECRFCGETGECLPECITVTSPAVEIKPSAALAGSPVDSRHLAGLAIDACEEELWIKIWPPDSDALSELLDRCEEEMGNRP